MKRIATAFALVVFALFLGACCTGGSHHGPGGPGGAGCPKTRNCPPCPNCPMGAPAAAATEKAAQAPGVLYWCACGPDCPCNSVSKAPGKCRCGKELAGGHVVWIEGSTALACTCGPDCSCEIDPKDRTKCGCGKPIKKVELKGTGLSFCNCGGSCGCSTVSDKPGACRCGMQLHQAP